MSHLQKLIRAANKAEQTFNKKQRDADAAAKRKAAIAEARQQAADLSKEIKAATKALKKKVEARKRKEAIGGAGVIAAVRRGGRGVDQLLAALESAPEQRMSKESVVGKGRYYRSYYYKRRKRPYRRKGKISVMQRKFYDTRKQARRSVYERAYRLAYPEMEVEPEELLAKFDAISKKRSASSRSTPETSPPRLAIKLEDLGSLLTY
jgi:hypothetical protein